MARGAGYPGKKIHYPFQPYYSPQELRSLQLNDEYIGQLLLAQERNQQPSQNYATQVPGYRVSQTPIAVGPANYLSTTIFYGGIVFNQTKREVVYS